MDYQKGSKIKNEVINPLRLQGGHVSAKALANYIMVKLNASSLNNKVK